MERQVEHEWEVSAEEAIAIQENLRERVITWDDFDEIRLVAGVDAGFEANNTVTRAAVAVLQLPDLALQAQAIARRPTTFPYVPGLLSFREIPAILDALDNLDLLPDLLLCDGQGIAHPRRLGLASHLGVLTGLPSIGVAKSRFVGQHDPVPEERGAWQPLRYEGETVGAVLRSRARTKPLYISTGHRVALESAIDYVMRCTTRYRLPETTRRAHRLASG